MGGIDILINNAGLMPLAPVIEGRVDEWEQTIDVNVKGVLFCINAVFPGMAKRRRGHIVNIGSVAGRIAFKGGCRLLRDQVRGPGDLRQSSQRSPRIRRTRH